MPVSHPKPSPTRLRRLRSVVDIQQAAASGNPAYAPLLARLLGKREESISRAAGQALRSLGNAGFYAVVKMAAHGHKLQREEAVRLLGEWRDVRAVQPLVLALKHDKTERNLRTCCQFVVFAVSSMLTPGRRTGLAEMYLGSEDNDLNPYDWEWFEQVSHDPELRIRAAAALGNIGDVRALLPLLHLTHDPDKRVSQAAQSAAIQLLPLLQNLTPERARYLDSHIVPALADTLSLPNEPLARLTLSALYVLGDERALPAVERFLQTNHFPYIQQEAQQVRAILQARAAQKQERMTLLRGASEPAHRPQDTLLRPAHGNVATPSDELLRPQS